MGTQPDVFTTNQTKQQFKADVATYPLSRLRCFLECGFSPVWDRDIIVCCVFVVFKLLHVLMKLFGKSFFGSSFHRIPWIVTTGDVVCHVQPPTLRFVFEC